MVLTGKMGLLLLVLYALLVANFWKDEMLFFN
jgi:hypothetical protein